MLFGWMLVIVYILLSVVCALVICAACIVAKRSPRKLLMRKRNAVSSLDYWCKEQMSPLHAAVHPSVLLPRKGSH